MRRIALIATLILTGAAALAATATGDDSYTYFIEADNAFGIVDGSEVKVAGVEQGTVEELFINEEKRAVIKATLSGPLAQLGEDSVCSLEPQSLIAEYFIDCTIKGAPLDEGTGSESERISNPDIPVDQTRQTVQNDLVQSALRQPFKERLQLIINEFGTALAGNPENLNEAIRRGAPALTQARKVTRILGEQNQIIRGLNVNSDEVIGELAERREDVRRFVEEARDTAQASAERRADLSRNFEILDDFLAELRPTMRDLNELAVTQTPLLRDLRQTGDGLNTLSRNLPDFNAASTDSLNSLGEASKVGRRALNKGTEEIAQLEQTSKSSFSVADNLAKFLRDIDDPDRAVEIDARAARDTGRKAPTGYTGLEGLLNYVYYQTGAINQFDEISHLLHFSIFEVESTPCSSYNAESHVPSADGGETTDIREAHRCVAWLGPNQPDINEPLNLPPYDPSVCPDGSTDEDLCDPAGSSTSTPAKKKSGLQRSAAKAGKVRGGGGDGGGSGGGGGQPGGGPLPGGGGGGGGGGDVPGGLPGGLDGVLDLPKAAGKGISGLPKLGRGSGSSGASTGATRDLLGFLFDD